MQTATGCVWHINFKFKFEIVFIFNEFVKHALISLLSRYKTLQEASNFLGMLVAGKYAYNHNPSHNPDFR